MSSTRNSKVPKISIQEVEIIKPPTSNIHPPKRMKLNNSTLTPLRTQTIVLNATINTKESVTNRHSAGNETSEDFFLKNENNCFYKCVFCSETIKSKPTYKTHIRTEHGTNTNKYHIQKGFVDATKEFCNEFIQTDFNIIQSLTSIFDQIDNIDRIVRDHKKRFVHPVNAFNGIEDTFLSDEVVVLKLYGQMIQRAFDILSEKNELITTLQDDVAELLEKEFNLNNSGAGNKIEQFEFEEEIVKEEEEEAAYELYYIDDTNQQETGNSSTMNDGESTNVTTATTTTITSKRGRPKGDLARSLDDCLAELPEATAEYIRLLNANRDSKYQCNECEVSAKSKMLLCVHYERVHLKRKNKICPHCGKPFASQGDLTRHIRIHSGDCPFKCNYEGCTSEFKTSGDLKKHKIVHERNPMDRPFICSECGSKFARLTDLTRHKKIHLIGKVDNIGFTCEICSKVFYRKDLFNAHLNNHLKIKPFECRHCMKRFAKKYDLLKHIDKQHQRVDCDECGDSFESRTTLIEHFNSGRYKDIRDAS